MMLFVDLHTRFKLYLLHFNELDINKNHLLTDSEYNDHSVLNFSLQFTPNQVDSTSNLLDDVVLTEVVLQPTKKPKSVGPNKSILKKNTARGNQTKKTRNS